ncbi:MULTISPECIES: hypothetical protein [Bacteria]|uniref:hypothetical protein n=1 Tax=Bacteria TaxID=2 RepID=UPI003F2A24A3
MEEKLYSDIVVKKIDLLYRKIKSRKEKEENTKIYRRLTLKIKKIIDFYFLKMYNNRKYRKL